MNFEAASDRAAVEELESEIERIKKELEGLNGGKTDERRRLKTILEQLNHKKNALACFLIFEWEEIEKIAHFSALFAVKKDLEEYEDARQNVFLWLLSGRFNFDARRPKSQIKEYLERRAKGQLIRDKQNRTGARLKRSPVFISIEELEERYNAE